MYGLFSKYRSLWDMFYYFFAPFFSQTIVESKYCRIFAPQLRNQACPDGGIGRRAGLKHQWIHFHPGSTPGLGTRIKAK